MKSLRESKGLGISCLLMMCIGTYILLTQHEPLLLIIGGLCALTGFLPLTYILIDKSGQQKVYRFVHYYQHGNRLNNQTQIVRQLNKRDITQLKEFYNDTLKHKSIIVDTVRREPEGGYEGQTKVVGWVIAYDKDEAIRTLHYTTDFNVPEFNYIMEDWDL
jgi:hypothetical protein